MTFREETLSKEALKALLNAKNKSDFLRSAVEFYVGFKDNKTHDTHSTNGTEFDSLKSLVYELIEKMGSNSELKKPSSEVNKKHTKQEPIKKTTVIESVKESDNAHVIPLKISTESHFENVELEKNIVASPIEIKEPLTHELSEVEELISNSISTMFGMDDDE